MLMKIILALILLLIPVQSLATTYYAQSGEGAGAITPAGSDSNSCTSTASPCLTISGALTKMISAFGYSGAGHVLELRAGDYNTGSGLKSGSNTLVLSGSSSAMPFTIRAYNASSPGTGCTPSPLVFGTSGCESVTLIRDMNPGSKTLAQMQSVGGPQCGGLACVGAPTRQECANINLASNYPQTCLGGSPPHESPPEQIWEIQDRSGGQVLLSGVVELYDLSEAAQNAVKYVVWDGISIDARGVVASCFRNGQRFDHDLMARFFVFKNGTWKNSTHSCFGQGGVANGNDANGIPYEFFLNPDGTRGAKISNDMVWENFKWTQNGIPFDTLRSDGIANSGGLELLRNTEGAKFLHAAYFHAGGNVCINCEASFNAGFFFTPECCNNAIYNSYIHDNNGGVQMAGTGFTIENSVFYNNGNTDIQANGINTVVILPPEQRWKVRNNTFVHGARGVYSNAIQLSRGVYGATFENNIIEGYNRGFEGQPCDPQVSGSGGLFCTWTDRNTIQSNIVHGTTAFSIPGIDQMGSSDAPNSNPVVKPKCANGSLDLTTCNSTADPLFTGGSCTPPNCTLQSGSPAVDTGFNNSVNRDFIGNVRPVGAGIDIGAWERCIGGACATAPTTAILTVLSSGANGVSIAYTGATCSPGTPIITTGSITCNLSTAVVLTAPPSSTGGAFGNWSNCTSTDTVARTCSLTLTSGTTVVANYGSTKTLTLATNNPTSGVFIDISPLDLDSKGGCTPSPGTPCIRTYSNGQPVTINVPGTLASGSFFQDWQNCPNPQTQPNYTQCLATMGADRTITATFGGNGCHIKKDRTAAPWNSPVGLAVTMCADTIQIFTAPDISGTVVGTQSTGATGTVVSDGTFTTQPYVFNSGYEYVKVNFNASAVDGWVTTYSVVSISPLNTAITVCSPSASCLANANTTSTTGTFTFSGSGGTAPYTFECSLDGAAFGLCSSPKTHTSLAIGSHTFQVRAIDSVPATDATPASYTWNVVATLPPTVTINSGPTQPVSSTQAATLTWTNTDCSGTCVNQCHLDGAGYTPCSSGISYSALATGSHTFYVKAIGGTALQSAEVSYPWTITLTGSGTLSVGACIAIIAPGSPAALNITDSWLTPANFLGSQPSGATGIITATNATTSPQGFTGIRVNWQTPPTLSGLPKNRDVDGFSNPPTNTDPDGWLQANPANVTVVQCAPSSPGAPPIFTGKIGGTAILKLGPATAK